MCCLFPKAIESDPISFFSSRRVTRRQVMRQFIYKDAITDHKTYLLHIKSDIQWTRVVVTYPRLAFSATQRKITLQSVLIKPKFLKVASCREIGKIVVPRSMAVATLSW